MMRLMRAMLLFAIVTPALHAQGTTRLLGRVVDLQGAPVRNVRLQIIGQGEPEILDSGEFDFQLSGKPAQVEVRLVGAAGNEIIYPLKGMLAVPSDPTVRVPVVIGKSERTFINEALAARLTRLDETLKQNGVRSDASRDSLGEGVRRIIQLLELKEADLRKSIDTQKQQADIKPLLFKTFDDYILEVKDLRDNFRLVAKYAAKNKGAVETLQEAVNEYNAAWDQLNNNRNAFQSSIRNYWSGAEAEGLERDLADVYSEAIETIHKGYVLPLNESLIVIQLAYAKKDRSSGQQVAAAVAEADRAVRQLDVRINVLEERYARLRGALERN